MPHDNRRHDPSPAGRWVARIAGAVLVLIGLALAAGGTWLAVLGGSLYYLVAGILLLASGVLLALRRPLGVWLYLLVFVGTVAWAFWEVGADPWGLVPRVVGPAVLLLVVLLIMPLMRNPRFGWGGAAASAGVALLLVAGGFYLVAQSGPDRVTGRLPAAQFAQGGAVDAAGTDWTAYAGTQDADHFSTLAQITPANVGRLERAWVYHTGDLPEDLKENNYGAETTPLKVGDTLYLCSATNVLIAVDPATGKQRWRYDPQVPEDWIPYTAACRGVSYYAVPDAAPTAPCATRIVEGTLDARIVEVDARTGRPCAAFGTGGSVNITDGMGPVVPGMVSITSPPVIVRGVIVTGHEVLDGQKLDAPSGVIHGYDAETGKLAWVWDMAASSQADAAAGDPRYTRGTPNMWTTASGDEELGLVYLPLGNSAGDYWSSDRLPSENAYSSSLVALDAETGQPRWHFQTVHKDVWDYDLGSQPTLVDLPGGVPAVILASKQGDIYVLDRRDGHLISRAEERPAPRGGVEPEQRAPTQPASLFHTLARPPLTESDMWGMSPLDQMVCRIQFRRASYKGQYTPPTTDRRFVEYPGYNGGSDWGGIAVDPVRGVIVANYNDMPNYNRLVSRKEANAKGWAPRGESRGGDLGGGAEGAGDPQAGAPYAIDVNAGWRLPFTGLLCKEPPYGGIRAIDLRSGKTIWDRPFGTARRNGPFGIPSMLPLTIGTPNNGGSVVTAGGLIFIAAATDDLFRAIDLRTGRTLFEDTLPAGGQATPMTYEANGRQYVVIMAGGHHFMKTPIGDELIAYALPG